MRISEINLWLEHHLDPRYYLYDFHPSHLQVILRIITPLGGVFNCLKKTGIIREVKEFKFFDFSNKCVKIIKHEF